MVPFSFRVLFLPKSFGEYFAKVGRGFTHAVTHEGRIAAEDLGEGWLQVFPDMDAFQKSMAHLKTLVAQVVADPTMVERLRLKLGKTEMTFPFPPEGLTFILEPQLPTPEAVAIVDAMRAIYAPVAKWIQVSSPPGSPILQFYFSTLAGFTLFNHFFNTRYLT